MKHEPLNIYFVSATHVNDVDNNNNNLPTLPLFSYHFSEWS